MPIRLTLFMLLSLILKGNGQCITGQEYSKNTPKRELRGVFLVSIYNMNWPSDKNASPKVQQEELIAILDQVKANGYNTVFLQVRTECDALYNSTIEPWSYRLTGAQGVAPNPFWDPLQFAVEQAHLRALDLHAWLNPYRASANILGYPLSKMHVVNTHPEWILSSANSKTAKFLNPGLPEVRDYITQIVQDIAMRYDVDGIHFDDYFYPDRGMVTNPDLSTFKNYNPENISSLEDWRRDNVNKMVAQVYDAIQIVNSNQHKNVVFGMSPIGIWKNGMPQGTYGNPSFSALYCDPIAWLNTGKVDYLAPQIYWRLEGRQDYASISKWWNDQIAAKGKQLYVSQAYYRMNDIGKWSSTEIQRQIMQNRDSSMVATFGNIVYNYNAIRRNEKGINDLLKSTVFKYKSFPPPISGKDSICPNKPMHVRIENHLLKWDIPGVASDGDLPVKYVVYAFDTAIEVNDNQNNGAKIIDIIAKNELLLPEEILKSKFFVVSSLDKNNNESADFSNPVSVQISKK